MNTTQIFHQLTDCQFLGRNGVFHQHGLDIQVVGDVVHLSPILRTGAIGRAWVSLPIEDIPAAIEVLQAICRKAIGEAIGVLPVKNTEPPAREKIEPKPLTLKVGRNYLLENGLIVKITHKNLSNFRKEFCSEFCGTVNPLYFNSQGKRWEGSNDIISEVPPPVFKIGGYYRDRNNDVWMIAYLTTTPDGKLLKLHAADESGQVSAFAPDGSFLGENQPPHLYDLVQQV